MFSIFVFLFSIEIESTEAQALFDQAHRLFACRFCTRERTMPVIAPSFRRRRHPRHHPAYFGTPDATEAPAQSRACSPLRR